MKSSILLRWAAIWAAIWAASLLAVVVTLGGQVAAGDAPQATDAPQTTGAEEAAPGGDAQSGVESLPWLSSLEEGRRRALAERKPILVLVAVHWCPACRKLEGQMETAPVQSELGRWTRVRVDVDRSPDDARQLHAAVVPALRIHTPDDRTVATHDGYLPAEELVRWLAGHYEAALATPDAVLLESGVPDAVAVLRLVRQFGERDPAVREAAIRRLLPHPEVARAAVVEAFCEGSLATRLTALDLLEQWHAPVEGIDPWRPETIGDGRVKALRQWSDREIGAQPLPPNELSQEQLASARRQIDRMLTSTGAEADAIRERLARLGRSLLPEVYARLKLAAADRDRERLLALRYRLVADGALVLRWPGGVLRLAATDSRTRQQAAEELAKLAAAADQPLLLELFSDPDPLVREISLRGLQQIGGKQATGALVKLLADPEPNVRAAVLKQLEEDPRPGMVPKVAEYLKTEDDPDLVVHAIRFLRATGGPEALKSLMSLLDHESWQVRAEAAAGLGAMDAPFGRGLFPGGMFDADDEKMAGLRADAYVALLELLDDPDAFVVSRAVEGLGGVDMAVAVEPLMKAAANHPQLAAGIVEILVRGESMRPKALPGIRSFCKHAEPAVRAAAIGGLATMAPKAMKAEIAAGLEDADGTVRTATASALFEVLEAQRESAASAVRPQAWDDWLKGVSPGQGRPKWSYEMVAPLETMLRAEGPEERMAAALALVPLGKADLAVPVLLETARTNPELFDSATCVLPWLPWDRRRQAFGQLRSIGRAEGDLSTLIYKMTDVPGRQAAVLFWELLAEEGLTDESAAALYEGLARAYFNTRHASASDVSPSIRDEVIGEAKPRVSTGSEPQRLVALALLAPAAPDEAAVEAAKLADDPGLSDALRRDAFQVLLATLPKREATQTAAAAMRAGGFRRTTTLVRLVEGFEALRLLQGTIYVGVDGTDPFGFQDSLIPEPPPGLEITDVRPLLDDPDPKIAAYAGYLAVLLGEKDGLAPLLRYWQNQEEDDEELSRLVYRAIAALNDSSRIPVLEEIYGRLDGWSLQRFYWTIRIMSGPEILRFRKRIRDEVGMSRLQ